MAGEETDEPTTLVVENDLAEWLDEQARETGVERDQLVGSLLGAYRSAVAGNGDLDEDVDRMITSADLQERLDEQREDYMDLIEDVRERVIQVKRETDRKAPADHDHDQLATDLAEATERLADLEASVSDLRTSVDEVEADLENGFQNYEDVLRYLKDTTDEIDENLDTLATALIDVRSALRGMAAQTTSRAEADQLKATANREGFHEADCQECSSTVDLSLLSRAQCPHCSANFVDVESKSGFFGSNTLITGSAPALDGQVADDDEALETLASDGITADRDFEWQDQDEDDS